MYTIYANLVKRYDYPQFQNFYDLVNHFCDSRDAWWLEPQIHVEYACDF